MSLKMPPSSAWHVGGLRRCRWVRSVRVREGGWVGRSIRGGGVSMKSDFFLMNWTLKINKLLAQTTNVNITNNIQNNWLNDQDNIPQQQKHTTNFKGPYKIQAIKITPPSFGRLATYFLVDKAGFWEGFLFWMLPGHDPINLFGFRKSPWHRIHRGSLYDTNSCNAFLQGKSLKFTIHLYRLIATKCVI